MLRLGRWVVACCIVGMVCAVPARAQDVPTEPPPEDRWTFTVAPYLWATSLEGNAEVSGVRSDVDVPFSDVIKDLSFGAMLLASARKGRFGVAVNGLFARVSPEEKAGPLDIDVVTDLGQLAAAPFYRVVEWQYGESASGRPLRLALEPYAGARLNHLRVELKLKGQGGGERNFDKSETWVDPIVGSRFGLDLSERWLIAGAADVGGVVAGSDFAWNVQGYLGWRTSVFGQPTTLAFGYRALHVDYDHNQFKWDVTQHGPILGAALRF